MNFAGCKGRKNGDGTHRPVHTSVPDISGASLAVDAYLHENKGPQIPQSDVHALGHGERGSADGPERGYAGVFHSHAHDMEYLSEWMGEMLDLTRGVNDGPARKP